MKKNLSVFSILVGCLISTVAGASNPQSDSERRSDTAMEIKRVMEATYGIQCIPEPAALFPDFNPRRPIGFYCSSWNYLPARGALSLKVVFNRSSELVAIKLSVDGDPFAVYDQDRSGSEAFHGQAFALAVFERAPLLLGGDCRLSDAARDRGGQITSTDGFIIARFKAPCFGQGPARKSFLQVFAEPGSKARLLKIRVK